jgi:large subunit ribosomal protein L35Ae
MRRPAHAGILPRKYRDVLVITGNDFCHVEMNNIGGEFESISCLSITLYLLFSISDIIIRGWIDVQGRRQTVAETVKGTKGVVAEFARSRRVQQNNFILIKFPTVNSFSQASRLIGRMVAWTSLSGRKLRGKIVSTHGKNGVVKARFQHGLPSQGLGTEIIIE